MSRYDCVPSVSREAAEGGGDTLPGRRPQEEKHCATAIFAASPLRLGLFASGGSLSPFTSRPRTSVALSIITDEARPAIISR
jgi:hypothetical protein